MALRGCRGVVCTAFAAAAVVAVPGCGEELYPQYTGSFRLVSIEAEGEALGGLPMPKSLQLSHRMRHSGRSFVHLVEISAPENEENAASARGEFLVPLSSLMHQPAAGTSENVPDYPGVQVLASRQVIRLGTWCSAEYLFTLSLDVSRSSPNPALLKRIYQGSSSYGGLEVQPAPNRLEETPIDESARDAWLSTASSNDGLRITLLLSRQVHAVVSGCLPEQDVLAYAKPARIAVTYETAGPWVPTQSRDPRKSALFAAVPNDRDIEAGLSAFFSQIFGVGAHAP